MADKKGRERNVSSPPLKHITGVVYQLFSAPAAHYSLDVRSSHRIKLPTTMAVNLVLVSGGRGQK
jgi:hypothetical protein